MFLSDSVTNIRICEKWLQYQLSVPRSESVDIFCWIGSSSVLLLLGVKSSCLNSLVWGINYFKWLRNSLYTYFEIYIYAMWELEFSTFSPIYKTIQTKMNKTKSHGLLCLLQSFNLLYACSKQTFFSGVRFDFYSTWNW